MTTDVMETARPRVGIIGGGFMGAVHSRAARSAGATLVGVASSSASSADRAARTLSIPRGYASVDELLADPGIDTVHVCTPNASHATYAHAAIAAGKNVICEKPLATSVHEAAQLLDSAEDSGVTATVPFVYRYHPMVREARARVAAGRVGPLLTIQGTYLQDWLLRETDDDWRVDERLGGPSRAFADIGSHLCDLIEFITGDRITRLAASKRTVFDERSNHREITTEDAVALVAETASGAIGTLLVSQVAPGRKNRLTVELAGTAESLLFNQEEPETLWLGRRSGSQLLARESSELSADAARLSLVPAGHPMGYQDAFNAFVADSYAAASGASPEGLPVFRDGLRAVTVTDAVLTSAADGAWVDVAATAGLAKEPVR